MRIMRHCRILVTIDVTLSLQHVTQNVTMSHFIYSIKECSNMNFMESFKSALYSVKANKMRSFLTMLGIIIGISSVITIVSLGEGGKKAITGQFEKIGMNMINIKIKPKDNDVESRDYFTLKDKKALEEKIPEVTDVIVGIEGFGYFRTDKIKKEAGLGAVDESYIKLANLEMLEGRFINERDVETNR